MMSLMNKLVFQDRLYRFDLNFLSLSLSFTHTHSPTTTALDPQGAWRKRRQEEGKMWRSTVGCHLLDTTHDLATTLMNSQELWIPAPDLYKINPDEILT